MVLRTLFGLFTVLVFVKLHYALGVEQCVNKVSLAGKTVIVTGATAGIGFATALECARRGARVILACRDKNKAERVKAQIVRQTGNKNVEVKVVDMSSLDSIRECAKDIIQTESSLDILINNAGSGSLPEKITPDGLQLLMQVNYFGPVLFTLLLLDLLKKSPGSRIVNLSSFVAKMGKLKQLELNRYIGTTDTYLKSKLCNMLFTIKLASELKGTGVSVFSVHPGSVKSKLFGKINGWKKIFYKGYSFLVQVSPKDGSQTVIFAATQTNIEKFSGSLFENCDVVPPEVATVNPILVEDVWSETLKLLNIKDNNYV